MRGHSSTGHGRAAVLRAAMLVLVPLIPALALVQPLPVGAQAAPQGASPSIARLRITPAVRTVAVGDSLRLGVEALDQRGNVVPGVVTRFLAQGGRFQGSVDSLGWVRAGSPGTVPIAIIATPAAGRALTERVEVRIVLGPAARVVLAPSASKLLVGQRLRVGATVLTASGDARDDGVAWTTSDARIARVTDGVVTAVAPGAATIAARAGSAETTLPVQVVSATGVAVEIAPSRVRARQGDVVRFAVTVKDARGAAITGLTPAWSISPGHGMIDDDGAFVGNAPGTYLVTAGLGTHTVDAVVTLAPRDVRRTATVVGRLPRKEF